MGITSKEPRIYSAPGGSDFELDELWQKAEGMYGTFRGLVDEAASNEEVPALGFAMVLAPVVATLLARHPTLTLQEGRSTLSYAAPDQRSQLESRSAYFGQIADALLHSRQWSIFRESGAQLTTSDIGWLWLPGELPGSIFLPVAPDTALLIQGGEPSYSPTEEMVPIARTNLGGQVLLFRDAMTLAAPSEVYAPSQKLAEDAIDLWKGRRVSTHGTGDQEISASSLAVQSQSIAFMLVHGAAHNPVMAWSRMIATQDRWGL